VSVGNDELPAARVELRSQVSWGGASLACAYMDGAKMEQQADPMLHASVRAAQVSGLFRAAKEAAN
jgi:hypothetical protein